MVLENIEWELDETGSEHWLASQHIGTFVHVTDVIDSTEALEEEAFQSWRRD